MTDRRLRVGIVGFGRIGRLRAQIVANSDAFTLVAAYDPVPFEAPEGCRVARSCDELVEHVDVVFVCTSNDATADAVVTALSADRHVLCEKPPGRSLEDLRKIEQAALRHPSAKLKFGFNHRYHEGVQDALALVGSGRFGELLWMRGIYGKGGGPNFAQSWRNQVHRSGGGILLDQGIHMIDLFRLFAGDCDFEEILSFVGTAYWPVDVEDNAFALLRNSRRQVAMLHSSSTHWRHQFLLELFLSEGYLVISGILSGSRSYGRETLISARRSGAGDQGRPREETTYYDDDVSWQREVDDFGDCILGEREVTIGTLGDARRAMELVFRIYESDPSWMRQIATRGVRA